MINQMLLPLTAAFAPAFQEGAPEVPLAIFVAALALVLFAGGIAAGRFGVMRLARSRKAEAEQLRLANEAAVNARAQAVSERERALGELDTRKQEIGLLENQIRSIQRQLDQVRAAWRASEKQVEDLGTQVKEARASVEALRAANVNLEALVAERQSTLNKANLRMSDLEVRLADLQSTASERQSLLANANAQISRYRARLAEVDFSASELESGVSSLGSYMAALRRRLADATDSTAPNPAPPRLDEDATRALRGDLSGAAESVGQRIASLGAALPLTAVDTAPPTVADAPADATESTLVEPVIPSSAIPDTAEEASEFSKLQAIKGIGVMYALKLTKNGINTPADLSATTVDQLEAIIRAPRWRKPDYADWIRQAREASGQPVA